MQLSTAEKILEPDAQAMPSAHPQKTVKVDPAEQQTPDWGEAQHVELTSNLYRRILAIVANVLIIAELFVAMYFAAQDMDEITPVFFKVFFSLLIPTIIGVIIARRMISKRFKE